MALPPSPPRLPRRLLSFFLAGKHASIVGDLEEEFYDHAAYYSPRKAALIYWLQALTTLPSVLLNDLFWSTLMLRNYFKMTVRTLVKNKGFSAINILGLAVSMSVCLLIILLIQDQRSADRFHNKADRIYRVLTNMENRRGAEDWATSPATLAEHLRVTYPAIEDAASVLAFGGVAEYKEKELILQGLYTDPAFFTLFDFELLEGDPGEALRHPNTMVIGHETALKFFGNADPVGETVTVEGAGDFLITGVVREKAYRSHLDFEVLASAATLPSIGRYQQMMSSWENTVQDFYTYVLLTEDATPAHFEASLAEVIAARYADGRFSTIHRFMLQPLTGINLGPELTNEIGFVMPSVVVYFLGGLALIIIITACFNYMSLSVARSLKRAREVGIRKVFGAHRSQIIKQFLGESVLVAVCALVIAYGLLFWLLPHFNNLWVIQFTGNTIEMDLLRDARLYLLFLGFSVMVGLAAGAYPALYLSAFLPASVLKGLSKIRGFSVQSMRKLLIVVQFCLSFIFIISTLLFYRQSGLMLRSDYGFNREHLVNVALQDVPYERFRNAVRNHAGIAQVSAVSALPATGNRNMIDVHLPGASEEREATVFSIDEHFLDNLGLRLVAGRTFSPAFATDKDQALLLNETALRAWGLGTPAKAVGQTLRIGAQEMQVVGVVADFHFEDFLEPLRPLVLRNDPERFRYANIRVRPGATTETLAFLSAIWDGFDTPYPFEYGFYDEQLAERYAFLKDLMGIVGLTAGLVILIACLGLLGMASYTAESRLREVGIRKILGASTRHVVYLLSRDFLVLIAVAVVLAVPLAWFANTWWLDTFVLRVEIDAGVMILGAVGLVVVALVTIGSQTIKASLANPVDTLRAE